MAKSVAEFHARANLDSSAFDQGAANMSKSMYDAARSVDDAWGLINTSAAKSAKASAGVFTRSGVTEIDSMGSQYDSARIDQAVQSNRALTAQMDLLTNSARQSAAVFEASFAEEKQQASARAQMHAYRVAQAEELNQQYTRQSTVITNSARQSAAVFEEQARAAAHTAKEIDHLHFEQMKMEAAWGKNAKAAGGMAQQLGYTSGSASRFGVVAQQVGYQVQDFAIQVAGGQNKLVAFAQQGSQLVSFFGPYGAIVGAVLNAGVMLYRIFDTATEKTKESTAALEEYRKILVEMNTSRQERAFKGLSSEAQASYLENTISDARAKIQASRQGVFSSPENTAEQDQAAILEQVRLSKLVEDSQAKLLDLKKAIAKAGLDALIYEEQARDESAKTFQDKSDEFDKQSRAEEEANTKRYQAISKQADAVREQLRPIEKMKREAKEISDNLFLSDADKRAAIDAMIKPTALPQALQVNAGASALGGTVGDGGPLLQLQQKMAADMHALLEAARAQLRLFAGV